MPEPRFPIENPKITVPKWGLIPAARKLGTLTEHASEAHWGGGITYFPENCGWSRTPKGICDNSVKNLDDVLDEVEWDPVVLYTGFTCTANAARAFDWNDRAKRYLAACESKQLAQEFARGTVGDAQSPAYPNRPLADPNSDTLTPPTATAFSPIDALACLEEGLADCMCGGPGWIHAPRSVGVYWSRDGLISWEDGVLQTISGTVVVLDAGYQGYTPDGAAPGAGETWVYATNPVNVELGPVRVFGGPDKGVEGLEIGTNQIDIRAERIGIAHWSLCCHLAARVDIPTCYPDGAS